MKKYKVTKKLKEAIDEQFDFWWEEKEIDDKEPLDREEPDDPIAEHDNREWQIAIDNRIE